MLTLIACSDDYLLEEAVREAVAAACAELGNIEPEVLPEGLSPEALALEVRTPSLFSPQRVLVVPDIRPWLDAPAPAAAGGRSAAVDVASLLDALEGGLPDDLALVLGAWCGGRPKGKLVKLIESHGEMRWIALPPPPKPWEDVELSTEQREVLRGVVRRAAPGVRLSRPAADLLLERLGFAPRLLAQEVRKLVTSAGKGATIEEELVRELIFPRERSLEVVRDAVLARQGGALLDLVAAAAAGIPISDWQGRRLDPLSVPAVLLSQVANLVEQMLYLRLLSARDGTLGQMQPRATAARGWYGRVFKDGLAPRLLQEIADDPGSPFGKRSSSLRPWSLGQLFSGAGRYRDGELMAALAGAGRAEASTRGSMSLAALSAWLGSLYGGPARPVARVGRA